ncbi:MAG: YqgE/AlgH family protein [Neisseriales bacterium]|nr:MAG: YqgE/AlgH family protein [Neisseriales bacterium]
MDTFSLSNHFLLATPSTTDPIFRHALIYLCEHKKQGAMGIIINKPSDLGIMQLFEQIGLPVQHTSLKTGSVLFGGPVQFDHGFVLHTHPNKWQSSLTIGKDLVFTTSKDVLLAAAEGKGPDQLLVTLGYAGWAAGQLEKELADNAWLTMPAAMDILFDVAASQRYEVAMSRLGFDIMRLSHDIGYA